MKLLTPSLILICGFVLGGMVFKGTTPNECDKILSDDSIFVLTGDARRIPFAMRVAENYPDADLYVIGAGMVVPPNTIHNFKVETESKSTYQNAQAIRNIATRAGLDRIVVITTEDHMNRAKYLMRYEMPTTEIIACPARLSGMDTTKRLERWTIEYVKYIVTMFGIKEG